MATTRRRLDPKARKAEMLAHAVALAKKHGWHNFTREQIARAAECSEGLVTVRLGTMDEMRTLVMREAVRLRVLPVVAQGLAARHKVALRAPEELRVAALATLSRA